MADIKGVREYNRIRRYLEHIYLYGFFSREDFEHAGIGSAKDYDYGTSLLRALYPQLDSSAIWSNGKKHLRFIRQYEHSGENRLANSYLFHSIDTNSELLNLLLSLLCADETPKSMVDIQIAGDLLHDNESIHAEYSTIRRRFLELSNQGYLIKTGRLFALATPPFRHLSIDSLLDLYSFVCYASEITYPKVAGSFLRRSVIRELKLRNVDLNNLHSEFLLRRNSNRGVFDEEIVYQLMDAIQTKHAVTLTFLRQEVHVIPIALRVDTHHGRWYLLALEKDHPQIYRISAVHHIVLAAQLQEQDWAEAQNTVLDTYKHSGCSGFLPSDSKPILVAAILHFQSNQGMQHQFLREIRLGQVVERNGQQIYEVQINDPMELLPFLRKFSPWLTVVPGPHRLHELLTSDLVQMKKQLKTLEETAP